MKNDKPIIPLPKEQPKIPAPPPPPMPPAPPKQPGEYSKDNGILFMDKEFNQDNCMPLVKMIIEYNLMPKDKAPETIHLYINSPGGIVTSGLAIYDTMEYIRPDVSTVCMGQAASMGSLLLTAGAAGKRFSLPNARIMTHQPSGGFQGQATDIEIHAKEILDLRQRLNGIYEKHSGKTIKQIEKIMDRDTFMKAEDAKNFGLIDEVVEKRPVPKTEG